MPDLHAATALQIAPALHLLPRRHALAAVIDPHTYNGMYVDFFELITARMLQPGEVRCQGDHAKGGIRDERMRHECNMGWAMTAFKKVLATASVG